MFNLEHPSHIPDGGRHLCGRGRAEGTEGIPSDVAVSAATQRSDRCRHNDLK